MKASENKPIKAPRLPSRAAYRAVAESLGVPATGYRPRTYPVLGIATPPTVTVTASAGVQASTVQALLQAAAAVIRAGGTPSK